MDRLREGEGKYQMSKPTQFTGIYGGSTLARYSDLGMHGVLERTAAVLVLALGAVGFVGAASLPGYVHPEGSDYYGWWILGWILRICLLLVSAAVFAAGALVLSGYYRRSSNVAAKLQCAFMIVVGLCFVLMNLVPILWFSVLFVIPILLAAICLISFAPRVASGEYSSVIVVYALGFATGFAAISHGCVFYAVHGSVLATVACSLGIVLVLVTAVAVLLHENPGARKRRRARLWAVPIFLVLLVLVIGHVMPQWFDSVARSFPDHNLRLIVRDAAGKPFGSLGFVVKSDLEAITVIRADGSEIRDVSGLQNCINIQTISLYYNEISDISPLVENPGLGSGDVVILGSNPLSTTSLSEHVQALRERGVRVEL